jgi:hypothetical protein
LDLELDQIEASLGGLLAQKQRDASNQAGSGGLERHDLERHAMGTLATQLQAQMTRMQMQVRQVADQMNAQYEQQPPAMAPAASPRGFDFGPLRDAGGFAALATPGVLLLPGEELIGSFPGSLFAITAGLCVADTRARAVAITRLPGDPACARAVAYATAGDGTGIFRLLLAKIKVPLKNRAGAKSISLTCSCCGAGLRFAKGSGEVALNALLDPRIELAADGATAKWCCWNRAPSGEVLACLSCFLTFAVISSHNEFIP